MYFTDMSKLHYFVFTDCPKICGRTKHPYRNRWIL